MKFTLSFKMDNAAFEDLYARDLEIEELLNRAALQVIAGDQGRAIRDSNGNMIGEWKITGGAK
jgi:hypothetical protein